MTAVVIRINGEYFIAVNNKLYYYDNKTAEEELGLDKLFRV
jgi:ligand-binding sensor domain-containing protein